MAMGSNMEEDLELEAFRRLYPTQFYEKYLSQNVRPDARPLARARETDLQLGTVATSDGSAMAKIGNTAMLAGVKLEVMTPSEESPEEGRIVVDFQMPPICSPYVRPGKPIDEAILISEQLSNVLSSSGFVNLRELSISKGKAAWMAYLDITCIDADGSIFDAALLAAVGAFANLRIPAVSMTEEGKVIPISDNNNVEDGEQTCQSQEKCLTLLNIPFSLTCVLYKNYLLADPNAEEERILQTFITVVLDSSGKLVSFYKPGGSALASLDVVSVCVSYAKLRVKELKGILAEALAQMDV